MIIALKLWDSLKIWVVVPLLSCEKKKGSTQKQVFIGSVIHLMRLWT
jgi:hypothetical protein